MWLWLLKFGTGLWSVVTSVFTFMQRSRDIQQGRDEQAAADDRETIAAQSRELQASVDAPGESGTVERLQRGSF